MLRLAGKPKARVRMLTGLLGYDFLPGVQYCGFDCSLASISRVVMPRGSRPHPSTPTAPLIPIHLPMRFSNYRTH